MRTFVTAALLSGLAGCGSGFDVRNPTCDAEFLPLSQSLTYHLMQGPGDGSFGYVPGGAKLAAINGSYDLVTGDFEWNEVGTDESWIEVSRVTGYGYANENGDLDIIGEREVEDLLGDITTQQFRTKRIGCQVESRLRYFADLEERERVQLGTFEGTAYTFTSETDIQGDLYEIEGTRWTDTSYEQSFSYVTDSQEYTGTEEGVLQDGTSNTTYEQIFETNQGAVTRNGTVVTNTDGSSARQYTQTSGGNVTVWDYDLDYGGDGSGTVTGDGFECTLTFTDGDCRYRCPSGQQGNC